MRWHSVSTTDGHALEGSFSFGVRSAALGGEHMIQQSPFARDGWLRVALRALLYAALVLFVGAIILRVLLPDREGHSWLVPSGLDGELGERAAAVDRRARTVVADAGMLAAGAAVAVALADAADAAGGLSAAGARDFLLANAPGVARVALVALILGAVALAERSRHAAAALAVLAVGAIAVSGHANSAEPRAVAVITDWVHLLGASVWLGGIALIAITWGPARRSLTATVRRGAMRQTLPRFGPVALRAFALVVASGTASALIELGHVQALWRTDYGRVLAVKIGLFAIIALLSYMHALWLRPRLLASPSPRREALERRHWRLLASEPLIGAGVVAAVAVLVAFPLPPRQFGDAEPAAAATACDPCPLPLATSNELAVAGRGGRNVIAAWIRRGRRRVAGEVRLIDIRGRPNRAPIVIPGATVRPCGSGCHRFSAPAADTLQVRGRDQGAAFTTTLPASWRQGEHARARRLLNRAQTTMRRLRSVRQTEDVTSGPRSRARIDYRLKAPDRLAYRTDRGVQRIEIGRRRWFRTPGTPWEIERDNDRVAFTTRSWFRWTTFAQSVQLVSEDPVRHTAQLASFDPGTPAWQRLIIDLRTMHVTAFSTATKGHFSVEGLYANPPVTIRPPRHAIDAP